MKRLGRHALSSSAEGKSVQTVDTWLGPRWRIVVLAVVVGVTLYGHMQPEVFQAAQAKLALLYRGAILEGPSYERETRWLQARKQAQIKDSSRFAVFTNFQFSDRRPESRITFKHEIVDDAAKQYKAIHYDHGNGLAAADVDGDGRADLYFVNQLGSNELWRNAGSGQFENITESSGAGLANRISVGASFADIDNDGDQDLFVTTVRTGNVLFENTGKGRFSEITQAAGLAYSGHSSATVFFDYDQDGLLDLFLTNVGRYTTDRKGRGGYFVGMADGFSGHLHADRSEGCIFYRNLGNRRFLNVTEKVGLKDSGWSGDASFADLNEDSFPDLYVLNMQGNDHYFENVKGKSFVDKTAAYFPKTPWGSMGIKFFDHDNDGLMDLLVTDMHSDMSYDLAYVGEEEEKRKSEMKWSHDVLKGHETSIWGNAFYRNMGQGKFTEISDSVGVENYWPWGVSAGDLNADGYADVFITAGMSYHYRYGVNSVLLNNLGRFFLDSEFILGVEPRKGERTIKPWFDVDCLEEESHRDCEGRAEEFTVMGSLSSRSSVILDVDEDGDLDIVTNEFNSEPQVLISNLAEKKTLHFLKVALVGSKSNRNGLGATVTVSIKDMKITQVQDGKSGYLSQSVLPLYFGLGESEQVDRIDVRWPSGERQTVMKPSPVNTTIHIHEGQARPR
jgi:enediyne biosynthesis protein E4